MERMYNDFDYAIQTDEYVMGKLLNFCKIKKSMNDANDTVKSIANAIKDIVCR